MNDFLERRYQKDPSIVYREIAGEVILVPIGRRTADLQSIFTLNETGARIWTLLGGQETTRDILEILQDEYDVPPSDLAVDFKDFINKLLKAKVIRRIDE